MEDSFLAVDGAAYAAAGARHVQEGLLIDVVLKINEILYRRAAKPHQDQTAGLACAAIDDQLERLDFEQLRGRRTILLKRMVD